MTFTGTTGVLELAHSQTYTGKVSGLSTKGTSSLDLLDIVFTKGVTKATYSGSKSSGILTVTDGTHTAKITLMGNYTLSTFKVSDDTHGGTRSSIRRPHTALQPYRRGRPRLPAAPAVALIAESGAGAGAAARRPQSRHGLSAGARACARPGC